MNRKSNLVLWALAWTAALLLLALGCGMPTPLDQGQADTVDRPAETVISAPEPEGEDATAIPAPTTGSEDKVDAERLVAMAVADLAQRLSLDETEMTVQSVEAVDWPDSSLGCPQPGMNYLQVVTPGYRLVLDAKGEAYEVHTDARDAVVFCDDGPGPEVAVTTSPIEPGLEGLVDQAKGDLAERLSVPVTEIQVLEARAVVWPDASLGCPKPGMAYPQVLQEGALIRLAVGPFQYEYHSGEGQEPTLCEPFPAGSKASEPAGYEPLPLDPPND